LAPIIDQRQLRIGVIGFWKDPSQVPEFLNDVKKATQQVTKGYALVADITEMKAPTPEMGALIVKCQKIWTDTGLSRTAEIHSPSAILKMAVGRFSEESGMKKV